MAILSNINGLFAVEDNGAIKFNNLTGTNNQVLIANTNSSPTWVDVSTIIGGPYLPLTGGTLAGAGNLVVGGNLTVNGSGGSVFNSTAASNHIIAAYRATNGNNVATFRTTDSGYIFRIHAQNAGTIYVQNDDGSNYLKIADSGSNEVSGNTTFTGSAQFGQFITMSSTQAEYGYLNLGATSVYGWQIGKAPSSGGVAGNESFYLYNFSNSTTALEVDTSNNATFAGDVMPAAENAQNIGSASVRWEDLYVDDGYIRNAYIDEYIYHNGETTNNISFTTGNFNVTVGGNLKFNVDANNTYFPQNNVIISSGNVGIGTTSPSSKLVVRTSTDHNFEVEETGGELRLSALNNARSANIGLQFAASEFNFLTGNVGIGDFSPGEKLQINGNIRIYNSSNAPYIDFVENGAVTDSKARITMDQIDGSNGTLQFSTESAGTLSTRMIITSGGQLQLQGSSSSLAKSTTQTQFAFIPGNTPGASLMPENPSGMSSASAGYHIVYGANNSSPYQAFIDVITYQCGSSTNVTVISSTTLNNSPGSRSYSKNSNAVFLNISGAVNYNCNIKTTFINFPH